ncbi:MAG TPA: hypothetical protein VMF55_03730 [Solirubrobacterales bacterium]|nr:hypothetical protein [Solirubrobacterales bacterium]
MTYAEGIDSLVLQTMCEEPGPWTKAELRREFDGNLDAEDAVSRLVARGLAVKVKGDFFAATASGRYAHEVGEAPQ